MNPVRGPCTLFEIFEVPAPPQLQLLAGAGLIRRSDLNYSKSGRESLVRQPRKLSHTEREAGSQEGNFASR